MLRTQGAEDWQLIRNYAHITRDGSGRFARKEAALAKAPAFWSWTDPDAAPATAADTGLEADRLRRQLRELRASWTWRLGRLFTRPLDLLRRGGAQRDASA